MKLDPTKCQPGDILLFYGLNFVTIGEGIVKGLKVMTVLPAVISAARGGASGFIGRARG